MRAGELIDMAARLLNDVENLRWPRATLLTHVAEAQRQTALARPDAAARTAVVTLVPGSRQTIPDDGFRLLDVIRNMGQDGGSPGSPVRFVSRSGLDGFDPDWHSRDGAGEVWEWVWDPHAPRDFFVHPAVPAAPAASVELVYAVVPAAPALEDDDLTLSDIYAGPMLDYAVYRALSADTESRSAEARAQAHMQAFYQSLGADLQATAMNAPSARKDR